MSYPSTSINYEGDGSTIQFSFPFSYRQEDDVKVLVDGVATAFNIISPGLLELDVAPAAGALVRIYRDTDIDVAQYVFDDGVPFLLRFADGNWEQAIFKLQELATESEQLSATTLRVPETSVAKLPVVAERANKVLGFDSAGAPIAVEASPASVPDLDIRLRAEELISADHEVRITANESAISTRIQSVATIADLQALTSVVPGQVFYVVEYSPGLGWGGGRLKAVSGTVSADNVLTFSSATTGIYFERLDVDVVDCDMAGIAGDGVTDDTVRLQAAIIAGAGRRVYLNRHCRLTAVGLQIPSNTIVEFGPSGRLELLPHNTTNYEILRLHDVGNIQIINPRLNGRRDLNSATTGEWGMGISMRGTTGKVLIANPEANNCWGDGYYIGATSTQEWCDDVEIINPKADNNRRQGLSLISAKRFVLEGGELGNTNGALPAAGVDIEPNGPTDRLDYVRINNLVTYSNQFSGASGILLYLATLGDAEGRTIDIEINNHTDKNSTSAITVRGTTPLLKGRIQFNDCTSIGARAIAMGAEDTAATGPRVEFKNPTIMDSNRAGFSSVDYSAPLNIRRASNAASTYPIGNVHFVNPTVILHSGATTGLFHARDLKGVGIENCSLIDPMLRGSARTMTISSGAEVLITDKFNQLYSDIGTSFSPAAESSYSLRYRHTRASGNSGFTLSDAAFVGSSIVTFENVSGGTFTVNLPAGANFVGYAVGVKPTSATGLGHRISIQRLSSTVFRVVDVQGTFTFA